MSIFSDDEVSISKRPQNTVTPVGGGSVSNEDPFPEINRVVPGVVSSDKFSFIFTWSDKTQTEQAWLQDPLKMASSLDYRPKVRSVLFELPMNPRKESRTQAKNMQFILSDGGYVIQNWGNGLIDINFEGTTGRLIPEDDYDEFERTMIEAQQRYPGSSASPIANGMNSLYRALGANGTMPSTYPLTARDSMAWKVFSKFNYFYQLFNGGNEVAYPVGTPRMATPRNALVWLGFWDRMFVGALTSFKYDVDADNPLQIKYAFNYKSLPLLEDVGKPTPITLGGVTVGSEVGGQSGQR